MLVSSLLASQCALALDVVMYSGSYNGQTDVSGQLITVPKFDPILGTLVSATFALNGTLSTSAFASNDGNFYVGWDKMDYEMSLVGDSGYSDLAVAALGQPTRIVGSGAAGTSFSRLTSVDITTASPSEQCAAPLDCLWAASGPDLSASASFVKPASSAYVGPGDLRFLLDTFNSDTLYVAGSQTSGKPAAQWGVDTNVAANVTVTYAYVAQVPEADIASLMIASFGMVGFLTRRRRSR
jgi:hypothetical protein